LFRQWGVNSLAGSPVRPRSEAAAPPAKLRAAPRGRGAPHVPGRRTDLAGIRVYPSLIQFSRQIGGDVAYAPNRLTFRRIARRIRRLPHPAVVTRL